MTSKGDLHKYVIVMASFVNMCLIGSHFSCFSLFYPAIVGDFHSSLGVTGWIGSLSQAMVYLPSVAYSSLLTRYGCRVIAVTGSLLASFGYICSSFTTSIVQLYFTYGILSGLGIGMLFLPTVVIVQQHFVQRPALPSGLSLTGLSIGVVIMSTPMQYCITTFGWRGALFIYGAVCFNGMACSILFTKVPNDTAYRKTSSHGYQETMLENKHKHSYSSDSDVLKPFLTGAGSKYGSPRQYSSTESNSDAITNSGDEKVTTSNMTEIIALLKDTSLIFYGIGTFCMNVGMLIFNMHTPNRSLSFGISPATVASLPTVIALGNIIARICFSFIANLSCTNRTAQYSLGILMAGLVSIGYSFTRNFWPICILCGGEGFFNGMALAVQPTVLVDLFTVEKLPKSHSILNLFVGVASLLATPFAGFLYDVSKDYSIPFIVGGCVQIFGFSCVLFVVFKQQKNAKFTQTKRETEPDIFVNGS